MFKFSTVSMEWTKLDAAAGVKGTEPSARSEQTMSAVGTDLYLFRGQSASGKKYPGQEFRDRHAGVDSL